ncbi:MAG: PLP-dependent aminotransferase family protein [Gammaproteobacteria bacterium]|nr:PLP-dependent aminotransferase family protein [Gammaproteobacteria bacterium]
MPDQLFRLPADSHTSLQNRIREMLVGAILDGHLPAGSAVPSGRKLARQLAVARNTVVLAYQQLVDEGYLVSRERSGYYVNKDILNGHAQRHAIRPLADAVSAPNWSNRLQMQPSAQRNIVKPRDWQRFPYPFVYGQIDPTLFPIADWRECCREAVSVRAIRDWSQDRADSDDPLLVEQIRTRVLPRRGVWAGSDEILITLGAQHALYILAELLLNRHSMVGIENPGYVDARNILSINSATVKALAIDDNGLIVGPELDPCDCLYVTPSHQSPTTVTMPLARREALLARANKADFVIIEDDYESETNYVDDPTPALKSMDGNGRVVYIGSLSKTLAPGLRMGYMVASRALIHEARALRRLMLRHPPSNNQHIVAHFLKRGHHDSLVRRLSHAYRDRWQVMGENLTRHLPNASRIPTFGGTSFWVTGPDDLDTRQLQSDALSHGIVLEPGDLFFMGDTPPRHFFRLGFSSIAVNRIAPGIARLAELIAATA